MYLVEKRNRYIFLNSHLDERLLQTVCAHEIGHDRFHRYIAKQGKGIFQEFVLYNMKNRHEYEANTFAAELRIDDNEILELIKYGSDIYQISGELAVDMNHVLIKIDNLRQQGYDVRAPYRPNSNFLK